MKKKGITIELRCSKGRTKLKFHQDCGTFDDEMNYLRQSGKFRFEDILPVKMHKVNLY